MEYCKRCVYPANAKPVIIFDDDGVCSGCRAIESRKSIDWEERGQWLKELLEEYKAKAKEENAPYDCIIPVSGGKDSTFQTYLMVKEYGMTPLLVTYNHSYNTNLGIRNLNNLIKQLDCDLIRFTVNRESVRKITNYFFKEIGDVTWHYHAGIQTYPMQMAVKFNIPLIIWGEEGFSELTGMFNQDDMIEFTKMKRQEHDMRGYEPEDLIKNPETGLKMKDLVPYFYPTDEQIESLGMRGIYLSNYINWNAKTQTEKIIKEFDFEVYPTARDRTFNQYDKTDDAANGTHDYLKYLKFGYGRATDDASTEIRHGRMTREEGIEMVMKHDPARPQDLDFFLDLMNINEQQFEDMIEHLRDTDIWVKDVNGKWAVNDSVENHANDSGVDKVRVEQVERTSYMPSNKKTEKKYYNDFTIL
tara:strand:+ start:1143 stop:2390 length:1248 start_codon:yes stop_codon:yes gene_type:complete